MGWNEPSGNNNDKDKDPWGNRGNDDGPPDLDEIMKKWQKGLGGIFGKKSNGSPTRSGNRGSLPWGLMLAALVAWLAYDMSYAIDQQERGVVLRFGRAVDTMQPGLNFRFPRPVEEVLKVNVGQVRQITSRSSMLTQDENIVDVDVAVKWQIKDPTEYLFNVYDPVSTLHQATESAVRDVIGKSKLDFALTEGRNEIAQKQQLLLQSILDEYKAGILIVGVELQSTKPPEQVKDAFDDVIKAREDKERKVNEAEAYRNEIIPQARGEAARITEESNGYKARVIAKAEGEASRFDQQLREYQRAPEITRQRLYLDAMENVFSNSSKILLDADNSNSLMYLPIDQLMKQNSLMPSNNNTPRSTSSQSSQLNNTAPSRIPDTTRGVR